MTETPRDAAPASEIARDETAPNSSNAPASERARDVIAPNAPAAQNSPVLVLVRDLMFSSRIAATARAAAVPITLCRDPAQLASSPNSLRLIVDLNLPGSIDAAIQWKRLSPGREVIGFVSHVDAVTIAHARGAGFDDVLPRSRFVEQLPQLLT